MLNPTPPIYVPTVPPQIIPQPMYTPPVTSAPTYLSFPNPTPSNEPTLMEIDAMHSHPHGSLTEAECLKHRQDGLCMYCGAAGHMKDKCPNCSPKAVRHFNAQATSTPSPTS